MNWVKIMCNILDHRKIKMIRKGPEGNTLVLLWLLLLVEAGKCNRGGYLMIADHIPYTEETISMITDIPLTTVRLGLTIFSQLGMIDQQDNDAIYIKNWRKYQSEDKLEERRRKDRLRQQRHREKVRSKMRALQRVEEVSRDSHATLSRDVTRENKQEKNRGEKTTTEQVRLLFSGTPFTKISDQELQGLEKRHGIERLLQAADIAAETWRRNPTERSNPGGYVNTLCTSLMVPEWYVPLAERNAQARESQRRKKVTKAEQAVLEAQEKEEAAATEALWGSLSRKQREEYLAQARASLPAGIELSKAVLMIMAKALAKTSMQPSVSM